ncbi:MAG: hypothetical protein JW829_10045 [Pirellulales bacterium]|nr:hypothetical protein [Pirellulales bacterium]
MKAIIPNPQLWTAFFMGADGSLQMNTPKAIFTIADINAPVLDIALWPCQHQSRYTQWMG